MLELISPDGPFTSLLQTSCEVFAHVRTELLGYVLDDVSRGLVVN